MSRRRALLGLVALALVVTGCTDPSPSPETPVPSSSSAAATSPSPTPTEEPRLAWGPTEAELEQATADAAELSDTQLAGQVLVARYSGTDPAVAAQLVSDMDLAGVILFSDNVASADQVSATAQAVQDAVAGSGRDWPGIVSTDNEGGTVQRLSGATGPWTTFPPFQAAGAASAHPDQVAAAYEAMGRELRSSGVMFDFAPDADVTIGPADVTIGVRSAGSDPQRVADTVVAADRGFAAGGVLTSLKHFPGHGSLTVDSHVGLPVLDASQDELQARDLVPFAAGIDAGAPVVMMGHIAVTAWDPGVPASLSPAAYQYLRDDRGFTGVAVTDGLDMGALTAVQGADAIAVDALAAGADLLLSPSDVRAAHDGILAALDDGRLDRDRLVEAAGRVIALVRWQAELAERSGAAGEPGDAAGAVADLASAATTVVAGECTGRLVGDTIHVRGASSAQWERFAAAAQEAGIEVVPLEQQADTEVRLLTDATPSGAADVAISLGSPLLLANAEAPTLVAAYGDDAGTLAGLVRVLAGDADAGGRLPVDVPGVDPVDCG